MAQQIVVGQEYEDAPATRNSPVIAVPEALQVDAQSGSARYVYAFELPQGTGGLTPALALRYSSMTQTAEYGRGWQLQLGVIERATRLSAPAYDDAVDQFEIDGSPLVRDPDHPVRFYRQPHNGDRIIYDGQSWVVTQPDGTQRRYGGRHGGGPGDTRSRLTLGPNGSGSAFRWLLDEVVDSRGNSYRIDYDADEYSIDGVGGYWAYLYPSRIRYSFHPTLGESAPQTRRMVQFDWGPRGDAAAGEPEDRPTSYRGSLKVQINRRLEELRVGIDEDGDGTLSTSEQSMRYDLIYTPKFNPGIATGMDQNPVFSQLAEIQRFGREDSPLPAPTRFEYTRPARGFLPADSIASPSGGSAIRPPYYGDQEHAVVDLNGDGLMDRIQKVSSGGGGGRRWRVSLGRAVGEIFGAVAPGDPLSDSGLVESMEAGEVPQWFDGYFDWGYDCNSDGSGCSTPSGGAEPYAAVREITKIGSLDYEGATQKIHVEAELADLDGDGRVDQISAEESGIFVKRNVGTGFAPAELWLEYDRPGLLPWFSDEKAVEYTRAEVVDDVDGFTEGHWQLADVDGDGRTDLVSWSVAVLSTGNGFGPVIPWVGPQGLVGSYGDDQVGSLFDINSDGLPDIVGNWSYGGQECDIAFNLGEGLAWQWPNGSGHRRCEDLPFPIYGPNSKWNSTSGGRSRTADINGDGWLDQLWGTSDGSGRVIYGLGDGSYTSERSPWPSMAYSTLMDLTGDGLMERVQSNGASRWRIWRNPGPEGLLMRVTNEFGGVTEIKYVASTAFVRREARSVAVPYVAEALDANVRPSVRPRWVVYEVRERDGRGGPAQVRRMEYAEFRDDMEEREYRGVRMSEETDSDGVVSRSVYSQGKYSRGLRQLLERVAPAVD